MLIEGRAVPKLEIIAKLGAEKASKAMSSFLKRSVVITVAGTSLRSSEGIPVALAPGEAFSVGLLTKIHGEVVGNAALTLPAGQAARVINALGEGKTSPSTLETFNAKTRSTLEKTASIAISSFMNGLAARLDKTCSIDAPVMLVDVAEAIFSVILMENVETADRAVTSAMSFEIDGERSEALLVFLPSRESLNVIREKLIDE